MSNWLEFKTSPKGNRIEQIECVEYSLTYSLQEGLRLNGS